MMSQFNASNKDFYQYNLFSTVEAQLETSIKIWQIIKYGGGNWIPI